jgi:putative regulatory protein recX
VGVDIPIGLVFAVEVAEGEKQDKMFEHVGMVAGMEGVAVAEHGVALSWERQHFIAGWLASATLAKYCR